MQKLVILHGWGGSKKTWVDFTKAAEKHYDVEVIELPCFGDEPCPTDVWDVEDYADFVVKRVNLLTNKPITILGHSFGGQIATVLAAKHPELVDRLILSGAAVIRPKKYIKRALFFVLAKCGRILTYIPGLSRITMLAKKVLYHGSKSPDFTKTSGMQREIFKRIIREDVQHYLKDIQAPTLVIWGEKDSYVPLKYGKKIANQIKHVQFEVIPNGTHGLHTKKIDGLLKSIRNFMGN